MSQVWRDGRSPKVTCSARTISGNPCKKPPIKGSNVCRTHGGAAPQVRAKAQVRILMSADAAAAKLIEMIHSKKIDDRTKLLAVKDLLDRANLSGTQSIEVGVTKRDFSDVTADVVMDLGWDADDEPLALTASAEDIEDADVVEDDDDNERWEREDAQAERAREIARMRRKSPPPTATNDDRAQVEARLIRAHARGELGDDDLPPQRAARRSPVRRVSMADPHADRVGERSGRRSMSPKRWEQRQRDGGEG